MVQKYIFAKICFKIYLCDYIFYQYIFWPFCFENIIEKYKYLYRFCPMYFNPISIIYKKNKKYIHVTFEEKLHFLYIKYGCNGTQIWRFGTYLGFNVTVRYDFGTAGEKINFFFFFFFL